MARDHWEMEQMIFEAKVQNGRQRLRLSRRRTFPCLSSRSFRTGKVSSMSWLLTYHLSLLPRWAQCHCYSYHPSELPRCSHCHGSYIKHLDTLQTDNTACEHVTGLNNILYTGLPVNYLRWFHFFFSSIRYMQKRCFPVNTSSLT